jgi:hypothetical protein
MATNTIALPYHLRAPRLRWASLAIDLDKAEEALLKLIATDPSQEAKCRTKARLLLGLNQRLPIHDLCGELHMDRRTLFRMAQELTEADARRDLVEHASHVG